MDIDFSSIDNLPNKVIENKVQKDSVKPSKKYMTQVKNKEKEEEWINKQYEYIKKSESLRGKITKGILLGEDIKSLLLSTIECIYLMTGDTAFYNRPLRKLGINELIVIQSTEKRHSQTKTFSSISVTFGNNA